MPKAGADIVICVGRESIESLATGEPVKVGDNEYLIQADSYDHPYERIALLEAALATTAQRLRYLADSADPKEMTPELHALARQCEDAVRGEETRHG